MPTGLQACVAQRALTSIKTLQSRTNGIDGCAVSCVIACKHSTTYLSCSAVYVLQSSITAALVNDEVWVHKWVPWTAAWIIAHPLLLTKAGAHLPDTVYAAKAGQT